MNILFFSSDNNSSSGAFISMVILCRELAKKNHNVLVIVPKSGTGDVLLKKYNIEFLVIKSYNWVCSLGEKNKFSVRASYFVKHLFNLFQVSKILNLIKDRQIDIIHINTIYSYIGAISAIKSKLPFCWHFRECLEEGQERELVFPRYSKYLMKSANRIFAISFSVYKKYIVFLKSNNIRLIYNGVDKDVFFSQREIFNETPYKLVFIGGFNIKKGAYCLLHALSKYYNYTRECLPPLKVIFVGNATDKFVKKAEDLLPKGTYSFIGYSSETEVFLKSADICFSGSKFEGFGRTTCEALLSGSLVITTNSGASGELVEHLHRGLTFNYGDSSQLFKRIKHAVKNVEDMRKLAKEGQSYALKFMTADLNASNIDKEYKRILGENE